MKFSTAVIFTSTTTMALAASVRIRMPEGPVKPDSYIVMLKSATNMEDHIESITRISARSPGSEFSITHRYEMLNGYSAHATGTSLVRILTCPEVNYVEADGTTSIDYDLHERDATERDNDGIEMEHDPVELKARADGRRVTIYSLETGALLEHACFDEELHGWGHTVTGTDRVDTSGHGTYVAAKAVGQGFSLATFAYLKVVKIAESTTVLSSNLIAGIEWVYADSTKPPPEQRGSTIILITCSLRDRVAINEAVHKVINSGLHVVASAGNDYRDAGEFGPASADGVITVGAVYCTATNQYVITHSNYGKVISVFALGLNIESAWNGPGLEATRTRSGTAPAAASVASMLACALYQYGWMSPAEGKEGTRWHAEAVVVGQPPSFIETTRLLAKFW
ncbi:peptidase S8/S53 domain-containing protein [Cantharellus anzutake]|uniref:peptidase S8/S53 domain-containing protein n=1 Tax=Cantharellus anzutake TaxID=1750568 RepID=UPI001905585C|nr:peptidase S8/S53 domain-containing protein [Cantharellus anzutake]KAF8341195.1 peptidase S8/S53 domain-containing protein [Cantharellus anzutake]